MEEDYLLSIDPGSENNMFVEVGGATQPPGGDDPPWLLVYDAGDAFIRITVPFGENGVVRSSNSIPVGVPSDGSVTEAKLAAGAFTTAKIADSAVITAKLADDAVTFAKIQEIATLRLLGRVTAGTGNLEEVTAAQLRDMFLPSGGVIGSANNENASASAAITAVIPYDGTAPLVSEGSQITSVSYTPKSAANKLRITIAGTWACNSQQNVMFPIFVGSTLVGLCVDAAGVANYNHAISYTVDYFPASTAALTISVRGGPGGAATLTLNPHVGTKFTLTVEEIKG